MPNVPSRVPHETDRLLRALDLWRAKKVVPANEDEVAFVLRIEHRNGFKLIRDPAFDLAERLLEVRVGA